MAVTKVITQEKVQVMADGQVEVITRTDYREAGKIMSSRRDARVIDVGDDVSGEDQLVQDVVSGNLHSAARKKVRDDIKAAESPADESG
jgi:hypothetical protein